MRCFRVSAFSLLILSLALSADLAAAQSQSDDEASAAESTSEVTLPPARFVFSTRNSAGTIAGFVVDPTTGELSSTGQTPIWAHWGPTRVAANVGATQLFAANQGSMDVSAYTIDRASGYLTAVPGANFATGGVATDIAVDPSNKFVYVSLYNGWDQVNGGQNGIAGFAIQSNGSLVPVPGSPFVTPYGDVALVVHPNGKFLYVTTQTETAGVIAAYSIDQTTGAIAQISGSPFTVITPNCTGCGPYDLFEDLAMDAKGKFLFVPGNRTGVIHVLAASSSTGALKEVPGSPFVDLEPCGGECAEPAGAAPDSITVSAKNDFVYVTNSAIGQLTDYSLDDKTGALTMLAPTFSPYDSFQYLATIRADPSGLFVYLLGYDAGKGSDGAAIDGLAIDQSTGSLSQVPNAPYPNVGLGTTNGIDGIVVTP